MVAGYGITVGIGQLVKARQSAILQIGLNGLVGRQEACVLTIGSKQVHKIGSLHDGFKVAILLTVLQVVAHHFARERVEVLCVGLVGATRQRSGRQQGCQSRYSYSYIVLYIHNLHYSKFLVTWFSRSWYFRHCRRPGWVSGCYLPSFPHCYKARRWHPSS